MATKIIGIAGSLRSGSYNGALLRGLAERVPDGSGLEIASLRGVPLYDGDAEQANGLPEAVVRLKEQVSQASGLLLATPEYNGSIPGVFKNGIDWMSRGGNGPDKIFRGLKVAVVGATPGRSGTVGAQTAWLQVFRSLGMRPWFGGSLQVSGASQVFDDSGAIVDDKAAELAAGFIAGFIAYCADSGSGRGRR